MACSTVIGGAEGRFAATPSESLGQEPWRSTSEVENPPEDVVPKHASYIMLSFLILLVLSH